MPEVIDEILSKAHGAPSRSQSEIGMAGSGGEGIWGEMKYNPRLKAAERQQQESTGRAQATKEVVQINNNSPTKAKAKLRLALRAIRLETNRAAAPSSPHTVALDLAIDMDALISPSWREHCAILDGPLEVVEVRTLNAPLPGHTPAVEHLVHLLEELALCLRSGDEHVNEGKDVKGGEDKVRLVVDVPRYGGYSEGEDGVPEPV